MQVGKARSQSLSRTVPLPFTFVYILFHHSFLVLSLKCKPTALCFQKLAVAVALRELLELFGPKDCTRDIYGDETEPPHYLQGKRHFFPQEKSTTIGSMETTIGSIWKQP